MGPVPAPEPSEAAIAAHGVGDIVRAPLRLARDALAAVADPGRTVGQARDAVEALGESRRAWSRAAPGRR